MKCICSHHLDGRSGKSFQVWASPAQSFKARLWVSHVVQENLGFVFLGDICVIFLWQYLNHLSRGPLVLGKSRLVKAHWQCIITVEVLKHIHDIIRGRPS